MEANRNAGRFCVIPMDCKPTAIIYSDAKFVHRKLGTVNTVNREDDAEFQGKEAHNYNDGVIFQIYYSPFVL